MQEKITADGAVRGGQCPVPAFPERNIQGKTVLIEQIENIQSKNDFIQFVRKLTSDFEEHQEEWANTTISDFLERMASWIEDYSESPANDIAWEEPDFQTFAKMLYMGKIYE